MALTDDQKKHLLIGGGLGALTLFVGSRLLGSKAHGTFLPSGGGAEEHHGTHRRGHHDEEYGQGASQAEDQGEIQPENERGEYGHKKHKRHHGEHGHGG